MNHHFVSSALCVADILFPPAASAVHTVNCLIMSLKLLQNIHDDLKFKLTNFYKYRIFKVTSLILIVTMLHEIQSFSYRPFTTVFTNSHCHHIGSCVHSLKTIFIEWNINNRQGRHIILAGVRDDDKEFSSYIIKKILTLLSQVNRQRKYKGKTLCLCARVPQNV